MKELHCILPLVYQNEVEPLTKVPWYELSQEELVDSLLQHKIDAKYIRMHYTRELEKMERKREAIEMYIYSRP